MIRAPQQPAGGAGGSVRGRTGRRADVGSSGTRWDGGQAGEKGQRPRWQERHREAQGASGRQAAPGGPLSLHPRARAGPGPDLGEVSCPAPRCGPRGQSAQGCAAAPLGPAWGYLQSSRGGSGGASGRLGSSWVGPRGFSPGGLTDSIRAVATISSKWPPSPAPGPMAGAGYRLPQKLCGCGPRPRLTSRKGGAQWWPVV